MIKKIVRYGNHVSKSNRKTKRKFCLNLLKTKCESHILNRIFPLRINVRTLRTIYKKGGFDEFLKNTSNMKLTLKGRSIKGKILKKVALLSSENEKIT